jgi:hypothetical protein
LNNYFLCVRRCSTNHAISCLGEIDSGHAGGVEFDVEQFAEQSPVIKLVHLMRAIRNACRKLDCR